MEIRRTLSCLSFSLVLCPIRAISTAIVQIHRCLRRFVSDRESTRINANKEGSNSLQKTKLRESFQANDLTFLLLIIRVNSRSFLRLRREPRWATAVESARLSARICLSYLR